MGLLFGSCWEWGVCVWDACLPAEENLLVPESGDLGETSNGAKSL